VTPLSAEARQRAAEILGRHVDDPRPIYDRVFDQPGRIRWRENAETIWHDILTNHDVDREALFDELRRSRKAAAVTAVEQELARLHENEDARIAQRLMNATAGLKAHLDCDRDLQWDSVKMAISTPPLSVVLLGGAKGRGHKIFLSRIRENAAMLGATSFNVYPDAVEKPTKIEHALAGLQARFGSRDAVATLAELLSTRNVFLLHNTSPSDTEWFRTYILDVLTGMVAKVGALIAARKSKPATGTLVAVLPVEQREGEAQVQALVPEWRRILAARGSILSPPSLSEISVDDVAMWLTRVTRHPNAWQRAQALHQESDSIADLFDSLEEELQRSPIRSAS
jgi:hypothetical protein